MLKSQLHLTCLEERAVPSVSQPSPTGSAPGPTQPIPGVDEAVDAQNRERASQLLGEHAAILANINRQMELADAIAEDLQFAADRLEAMLNAGAPLAQLQAQGAVVEALRRDLQEKRGYINLLQDQADRIALQLEALYRAGAVSEQQIDEVRRGQAGLPGRYDVPELEVV